MSKSHSSQAGSALILILIGVTLFAALSYAVVQMMRSGDSAMNISEEKAGISASEILDYGRTVRLAVQDLRISNGCADTDISFENSVVTAGYTNGANTACQVFHPDGGALSYAVPSTEWLDSSESASTLYGEWYFSGDDGVNDLGSSSSDLILFLPWINENLCDAINTLLSSPSSIKEDGDFETGNKFTGSYGTGGLRIGNDSDLSGFTSACMQDDNLDYFFYQVLIAR